MSGPRTFQLKASQKWAILPYKGKPRIVMNRQPGIIRQPIKPWDVLSVRQAIDLMAWLSRYLNVVAPTEQSVLIAGVRANARGIERNLVKMESKVTFDVQHTHNTREKP